MTAFIRYTLFLLALSIATTGIAKYSASQQNMPITFIFTNPDGTPCKQLCLFGVEPGVTSFDQALQLLRAHPFTHDFEPNLAGDILRQGSIRVIIAWGLSNERVSIIELVAVSQVCWARLGEIIGVLGPPERVLQDGRYTRSYWREGLLELVHVQRQPGELNPEDRLDSVIIQDHVPQMYSRARQWQGFSTVKRYLEQDVLHP